MAEASGSAEETEGKRKRRRTVFEGFQTFGDADGSKALSHAIRHHNRPDFDAAHTGRNADDAAVARRRQQKLDNERDLAVAAAAEAAAPAVKKTPGVQNATRRVLEWLNTESLTLQEITQRLPKLSKAKVQIMLDTLRTTGLVRLIRRQITAGVAGTGSSTVTYEEYYQFDKGQRNSLHTQVDISTIGRDFAARKEHIAAASNRIAALQCLISKPEAELDPAETKQLLLNLMKADKGLEEDPLYAVVKAAISS